MTVKGEDRERLEAALEADVAEPELITVRAASIRPDGLAAAGLKYGDASLASSTGPVFDPDDLPDGVILTPSQAIKGLYAAFNARDAACAAAFLTEECVYEDLLLGPATVCRGKDAFMKALQFHPAFVGSRLFGGLPFSKLLPELTLEIDSIAGGENTVGVEWHVQYGESAFPLGRGLSQARVCTRTGKIERVVDIAEAPWRVIGLVIGPLVGAGTALAKMRTAAAPLSTWAWARPAMPGVDVAREYDLMLAAVLVDGIVDPSERTMLAEYAAANGVSDEMRTAALARQGWTPEDFTRGKKLPGPAIAPPTPESGDTF
jgi:hypothetical protein